MRRAEPGVLVCTAASFMAEYRKHVFQVVIGFFALVSLLDIKFHPVHEISLLLLFEARVHSANLLAGYLEHVFVLELGV